MDRTRESRRGGGHAVSGHATARRRPRSTFKDSSVDEEEGLNESHDSLRLRERSTSNNISSSSNKKERSSLSSNRNKRKRPSLQERFHGRDREMERDEGDDSSEESSAAEAEEEEEDDDEPPHHRPPVNLNSNLNPKRTAKFKSQWKVSEELTGVGLVPVPRKARSAPAKRHHDSSSSSPSPLLLAASVSAAPDSNTQRRQKSPSPVLTNVASGASPSSSNASLKPGRRMKPIGSKPRPPKMAKVSNSISEREVEVAEVLYGLRQFQSEHPRPGVESYGNANPSKECPNDGSLGGVISRVSSPMIPPSSSVASSPSSSPLPQYSTAAATPVVGQAPPTAPKKKRPRPAKPEEANGAIVMRPPATVTLTSVVASCSSGIRNENEPSSQYQAAAKIEVSSLKLEALGENPSGPNANANVNVNANQISTATPSQRPPSPPPVPANQIQKEKVMPIVDDNTSADLKPIAICKSKEVEMSDLKISRENGTLESKTISSEEPGTDIKVESIDPEETKASEDLDVSEAQIDRIENKEMDMPCGSEIKLESTILPPQSPKTENIVEEKFKIDLMAPPEKSEDESVADACVIASSELPRVEQITQILEIKALEELQSKEGELKAEELKIKHEKSDEEDQKGLEKQNVTERSINLELDLENSEKDSKKPLQQKQSRITRNEFKTEKAEKPVSAAAVGTSASGVASIPNSMPGQAWPPGVLSLGYFASASASANWPGSSSLLEGTNTTAAIQPPYIFQQPRQTWKRCATHSYIAHFIDCQQRMAQLPFWPPANYLGSRQYNLNAPFPPPSEIINFGGSISGTVSASSAGNSVSINRSLDSLQDKGIGTTPLVEFKSQSVKEKISNNTDARRKQPPNQQATRHTSSSVMQCGVGGANSSTAGKSVKVEVSLNSSPSSVGALPSAGSGPASNNLASISPDAQYMAMFQSGYPYPFNPHFGTGYNGAPNQIGQQQVAQFFNTPFYATQLLDQPQSQSQPQSLQQGPQNPSTSSGSSSSQQHKQQMHGSRKFPAPRKQQQQGTSSPTPSNSQQHHHLPTSQARHIDREANNEGDSPSSADSRHPVLQKTFYSSGSPSNSNLGVTSSLLASGVRIQAQDLTLMAALGGKQNGKQQQLPPQLQHQVPAGYTIQQHHGNDPTVQMSLKGLELSQSHAQAIAAGLFCFPSMAQGIPESARHQMAAAVQAQQNAVQPGLHPQRPGLLQRTQTSSIGDDRSIVDPMSNAGGRGHDEERKSPMKGLAHSLNFSRIETENSTNIGSSTDGGLSSSLVTNNMDGMSKIQNRSSQPAGDSSQGSPQLSSTQKLNQNTKQTGSRAKNVPNSNAAPPVASAQTTMSGYPDRAAVPSNLSKFQAPLSSFAGQNLKQGQQSPQWKMAVPCTNPAPSQANFVAATKNYPQQPRNQQGNTNTGTSSVGSPQALYGTSTKNSGQLPMNQKNNSTSVTASRVPSPNIASVVGSVPTSSSSPVSKSAGSPASRSPTGSKGSSSQQKSVGPTSNKRSSPVSSRNLPSVLGPSQGSQSSSGKSIQQQYQQQSMPPIASGQPAGLKNQQYHNQAHLNHQMLLSHAQSMQQHAAQQSQFPAQTGQVAGFHQKQQMHGPNSSSSHMRQQQEQHQQMHGSNSPQPSFSTNLRQQEQQQQMQSVSSTHCTPSMLSLGPPTLTLGGAAGPGKANAGGSFGGGSKGNTMLQAQYCQQHVGNPRVTMASPYIQAATNASTKSMEQRVVAESLNQEQMNGIRAIQNSASQSRCSFSTSSPQSSSTRMPPGSLKKTEGSNSVETTTNPSGLSLSMTPCSGIRTNNSGLTGGGNAMQNAKTASVSLASVHSSQMPTMPIHQPAVPLAGGSITPATSTSTGLHGQTAASVVQP